MWAQIKRLRFLGLSLIIIGSVLFSLFGNTQEASAYQFTSRSLAVSNSDVNANATDTLTFELPDTLTVGSFKFRYCTTSFVTQTCTAPNGVNTSGANLIHQSGETGFSVKATTQNSIIIGRVPHSTLGEGVQYVFSNIINPSGVNQYFFVQITSYASTNGSGSYEDYGTVVSSTTQAVDINPYVPPILNFCVGQIVATDCSSTSGDLVQLNTLSSQSTATATSQMSMSTNAAMGAVVSIYGTTLSSGNNTIDNLTQPSSSTKSINQFGFNLRTNSSPNVGSDPTGAGTASPYGNYSIPNRYTFNSGDIVASSPGVTDFRKMTSSYIVNVNPGQPVGIYSTTLTYICTATF